MSEKGIVKWFDTKKGYGFIATENRIDYFVRYQDIEMIGFRNLYSHQAVTFEANVDNQNRTIAKKIVPETKEK